VKLSDRKHALRRASQIASSMAMSVIGLAGLSTVQSTPAAAATAIPTGSKPTALIVPAYQYPLSAPDTLQGIWADLAVTPPPGGKGYVIANPSNGPGSGSFFSGSDYTNYLYAIGQVQAAGWTVLGYTPTEYGTRTLPAVEGGVGLWKSKYGSSQVGSDELKTPVTGIFFDTACAGPKWTGSTGAGCTNKPSGFSGSPSTFFSALTSYVHTHLGGIAVVNVGAQPLDATFLTNPAVDDAAIIFENNYSAYTGSPGPSNDTGSVNQLGTIVWDVSTLAKQRQVLQRAQANGSNLVYVTTEDDDNFYCPPGDVYAGSPPVCTLSVPNYFQSEFAPVP
jgi:hypothetical protein